MGLERRDRVRWLCEHHNWQQEDGDAYDRQAEYDWRVYLMGAG